MNAAIQPKRIAMVFTYEANPLVVVKYDGHNYKLQRLIISIEPYDEPADEETSLYVDIDAWGKRLTSKGEEDRRTGFDRIYISPTQVQTFIDDARRRYSQVKVAP